MSTAGQWRNRAAVPALSVLVAFLLVAPLSLIRIPKSHDMAQHVATLEEFDTGLRDGSLYPRWQAGFNYGYGLPFLNYYQPGFFYQAELFYCALHNGLRAMLAASILNMALAGLAFYWLARLFYGLWPAAAGALIYITPPHHLLELSHR